MTKFIRLICSIIALCFIPTSLYASSGSIGIQPGIPRSDVARSESIFVHTIRPNQTIQEAIKVTNNSNKAQTVVLYGTDAIATNSGSFTCEQRAEAADETGKWITFSSSEMTVSAGQTVSIPFSIQIPDKIDVGEHNACVALETKDDPGVQSGNLRVRTRSAIRVALTVPGELKRAVAIDSFHVEQHGVVQQYTVSVRNAGNVSADTKLKVRLTSLFGSISYENGGEYPVLAGKKLDLSYKNDQGPLLGGWYIASVTAAYDERPEVFGANQDKHLLTVSGPRHIIFFTPQPAGLLIITLILGAIGVTLWRLIRQRQDIASWKDHKVKAGQSIQGVAEKKGVSWKKIAKYNKIKAPYTLVEGSIIKLPANEEKNREP